jgi:hypothetical protein
VLGDLGAVEPTWVPSFLLGSHEVTPQFGILGRFAEATVGVDLTGCNTISLNPANRKRWILPTILFCIGAIIGMTFLASVLSSQASFWTKVSLLVQWLLIPGFILLVRAYVFVHGDRVEIVFGLCL